MSRMSKLYNEHIAKDERLWNELESCLEIVESGKTKDTFVFERIDKLIPLIHDNNYMLITLVCRLPKEKPEDAGNH